MPNQNGQTERGGQERKNSVLMSTKTSLFTAERSPLFTMASMRAQGGCEKADSGTETIKPQGAMKAKGMAADTEVEFLEMKWSAG